MRRENSDLDVLIVGGGPGGISAAIWCAELGLRTALFEREPVLGGQLRRIFGPIRNYPGIDAADGEEMAKNFIASARDCSDVFRLGAKVIEIDPEQMHVKLENDDRYSTKAVIFATGVRRRRLGVPGESGFEGKGVLTSGFADKELASGRTVAIVGGGDAALENALILADAALKVYVIHRSGTFRARKEFVDQAAANDKIEFVYDAAVTEIGGAERVESVSFRQGASLQPSTLHVDLALVRIGVEPNSELLRGKAELDEAGYVIVNPNRSTSRDRIFAIGDVANPSSPTIVTAAGDGAAVSKFISNLLTGEKRL